MSASAVEDGAVYRLMLGERIRHVRQQQGLSLLDVERSSDGEFKASVLGAYERGERTISIPRLERMASFYRVPVAELLPDIRSETTAGALRAVDPGEVSIDLQVLEALKDREPVLHRYVSAIQARRGDYNGRVITVRKADLDTLSAVYDDPPGGLRARLANTGILREVDGE